MDDQKRAPSLDMASIALKDMLSPAPTYSSTFISHGIPFTPSKSDASNNPYYQPTTPESPFPIRHSSTIPSPKDAGEARVKPDYQDTNHPHFAGSARPGLPSTLPAPSRMPRRCILVPWVLFAVFFLITIWFTSILLGARFLSVIDAALPAPAVQEIHVYINGEALHGNLSVFTRTDVLLTSTVTSTTKSPIPTKPIPQTLPGMSKGMDRLSTSIERRPVPAPTGFATITRRGS